MTKDKEDVVKPGPSIHPKSIYVLGVDPARRGEDQTALVILEKPFTSDNIFVSHIEAANISNSNDVISKIVYLHALFNFKKIYLDETGLGGPIVDSLRARISQGIVEGVTFTRNSKAEMFYNLKLLMQQGKFKIPNYLQNTHPLVKKMYFQFLSIQQEFTENSEIPRIYHEARSHDDIICAMALAALYFNQRKVNKKKGYFLSGRTSH